MTARFIPTLEMESTACGIALDVVPEPNMASHICTSYVIFIKGDVRDYEDDCMAESKEEAAKIFAKRINSNLAGEEDQELWKPEELMEYITGIEDDDYYHAFPPEEDNDKNKPKI